MLLLMMIAATPFNLVCPVDETTGTLTPNKDFIDTKKTKTTYVYHVDLGKMRWCVDNCTVSFAVGSANETVLTLQDTQTPWQRSIVINRENGNIVSREQAGSFVRVDFGVCSRADFTGLPQPKF